MRNLVRMSAILLAVPLHAQFAVYTISGTNSAGKPFTGYVAYVELKSPSIAPVATAALASGSPCATQGQQVQLTDTITFAQSGNTILAVNANLGPSLNDPAYTARPCGSPYGLLKSGAAFVSPVQQLGGPSNSVVSGPSLWFPSSGSAVIGTPSVSNAVDAQVAISGWIGCQGATIGTPLVTGGGNYGSTAQPVPTEPAPRTGAGINATQTLLLLVMVNGNEGAKTGLPLPDFASLFIALGASNAVNLDGGGSSTFAYTPGGATISAPANLPAPVSPLGGVTFELTPVSASSTCYSYPHGNVTGQNLCLSSPGTGYRPVYANFGFVAVSASP